MASDDEFLPDASNFSHILPALCKVLPSFFRLCRVRSGAMDIVPWEMRSIRRFICSY
jgi:hypothetical protein